MRLRPAGTPSRRGTAIVIPRAPAAFAPLYGMLTDRFGVTWIVGVETPQAN